MSEKYFILTVDIDGWSSLLNFYSVKHDPIKAAHQVKISEGINSLLKLFNKHSVKATFFTVASVADSNKEIIKTIHEEGHEVGCHGFSHERFEFHKSAIEQEESIKKATQILTNITGVKPKGFRAPCLTFNETTFDLLRKYEYEYDSSVTSSFIPGYYGVPGAPNKPYRLSDDNIAKRGSSSLIEIPVTVNPIIPLPLSAAWMRNLGTEWVKIGIRASHLLGNPVTFYIHPRDVSSLPRIIGVPWHLYTNTGNKCITMMDKLLTYVLKHNVNVITGIEGTKLVH